MSSWILTTDVTLSLLHDKINPTTNTDGSGNFFVTIFANRSCTELKSSCSCTRIPASARFLSFIPWQIPYSDHVCTATLHKAASTKFLHRDKFVVPREFVPRLRQNAIKIVPGWQKPRHGSLPSTLVKYCRKLIILLTASGRLTGVY